MFPVYDRVADTVTLVVGSLVGVMGGLQRRWRRERAGPRHLAAERRHRHGRHRRSGRRRRRRRRRWRLPRLAAAARPRARRGPEADRSNLAPTFRNRAASRLLAASLALASYRRQTRLSPPRLVLAIQRTRPQVARPTLTIRRAVRATPAALQATLARFERPCITLARTASEGISLFPSLTLRAGVTGMEALMRSFVFTAFHLGRMQPGDSLLPRRCMRPILEYSAGAAGRPVTSIGIAAAGCDVAGDRHAARRSASLHSFASTRRSHAQPTRSRSTTLCARLLRRQRFAGQPEPAAAPQSDPTRPAATDARANEAVRNDLPRADDQPVPQPLSRRGRCRRCAELPYFRAAVSAADRDNRLQQREIQRLRGQVQGLSTTTASPQYGDARYPPPAPPRATWTRPNSTAPGGDNCRLTVAEFVRIQPPSIDTRRIVRPHFTHNRASRCEVLP